MKKLPLFIAFIIFVLVVLAKPASAQSGTESGVSTGSGTLPQTGIETPIMIIGGTGILLFGSGFLFRKLQKAQAA